MFMLFLLAGVVLHAAGQPLVPWVEKDWLWWTPPAANATKGERLDLSEKQLLKLRADEWRELAIRKQDLFSARLRPELRNATIEHAANTIYGLCMRERNEKIFARKSKREQSRIRRLRAGLFRFGMTCIAMEVALNRGATTQVHAPSRCFIDVEDTLHPRFRIHWNTTNPLSIDLPLLKKQINLKVSISPMESGARAKELQRWKERAFNVFSILNRDLPPRHSSERRTFEDYLRRWINHIDQ